MLETLGKCRVEAKNIDNVHNLRDLLLRSVVLNPNAEAIIFRKNPFEDPITKTYFELAEDIFSVGEALQNDLSIVIPDSVKYFNQAPHADNLRKMRIAILGENKYEWIVAHNVAIFGAGISVPLDKQLSSKEVINLLNRSHSSILFLDSNKKEILNDVLKSETDLCKIYLFGSETDNLLKEITDIRVSSFAKLLELGINLRKNGSSTFENLDINPDHPMAIYFTSGTTAQSKGVILSHRNVLTDAIYSFQTVDIMGCKRGLSVLPLHHTFENTVGIYCYWLAGITICLSDGLHYLLQNLKEWNIDIMITVPLMLERIESMAKKTMRKQKLDSKFTKAQKISNILLKFHIDIRRKLFSNLLEKLAPNLKIVIVGAAALKSDTQIFFNSIGINTYGGYGLTETSPVLSCCNKQFNKIGSVGQPLNNVAIKIDSFEKDKDGHDIGEILAKGENIMLGYYANEAATREVLEDGYFRTGDIGYLDEHGVIFITGRAKSMIVLQNGKKMFPEETESLINSYDGISASLVYHQINSLGKDEIVCRLCIDKSQLPENISTDDDISEYIKQILLSVNSKSASYKNIQYMIWNEETPIMTATLKIKRLQEQKAINERLNKLNKGVKDLHLQRF